MGRKALNVVLPGATKDLPRENGKERLRVRRSTVAAPGLERAKGRSCPGQGPPGWRGGDSGLAECAPAGHQCGCWGRPLGWGSAGRVVKEAEEGGVCDLAAKGHRQGHPQDGEDETPEVL